MKKIVLFAIILSATAQAQAQKISGTIYDEEGKPANAGTVSLLRGKDSSAIKYATTNKDGKYSFAPVADGQYLVSASHIGYSVARTELVTVSGGGYKYERGYNEKKCRKPCRSQCYRKETHRRSKG